MGSDPRGLDGPVVADHGLRLRLAIIAPGEIFGGAERQILALARELASGAETAPLLILFHDRELADRARRLGIPVRVLGARGLFDPGSIRSLRRTIREERIDVVSLHGYRASAYLALAAPPGSVGVVKTEHGGTEETDGGLLQRLRPGLYRRVENLATRRLGAHVVYVTHELRDRCNLEHTGLARSVIYNGITPLDRTSTSVPPEFRSDVINLIAVGRLEPVKGFDIALRALTHAAMPPQAHLFLVGAGPEQQRLTELARDLGVTSRVSSLGFRENAYDYIAHADALLMPSHHEGLPYTLLEALALETPVIASRVGGLAEILTDRSTALLVEPGNPAALASAVRLLTDTPGLREELTRNGLEQIATRFTGAEMARQYRLLFEAAGRSQGRGISGRGSP